MNEEWKDIKGYEGRYQVSSLGKVRGVDRLDEYGRKIGGMIISQRRQKNGYKVVNLSEKGKKKTFRVHRLVADAFCVKPDGCNEVNHKDEDKNNNSADNLEWCTRSYNCSYGSGVEKRKAKCSIPCVQLKNGIKVKTYPSIIEASRQTGIPMIGIQRCIKGVLKHTHGFQWSRL